MASICQPIPAVLLGAFLILGGNGQQRLPECKSQPEERGYSEEEKRSALELHNDLRQAILKGTVKGLPKAKTMPILTWDDELEKEAQRWADCCPGPFVMPHPPSNWYKIGNIGQNVCWGHPKVTDCIQAWFDEHINYTLNGEDPLIARAPEDPATAKYGTNGHFTMMVGDMTKQIGCGRVKSDEVFSGVVHVCHYFPAGNVQMVFRTSRGTRREVMPAYRKDVPNSDRKLEREEHPMLAQKGQTLSGSGYLGVAVITKSLPPIMIVQPKNVAAAAADENANDNPAGKMDNKNVPGPLITKKSDDNDDDQKKQFMALPGERRKHRFGLFAFIKERADRKWLPSAPHLNSTI